MSEAKNEPKAQLEAVPSTAGLGACSCSMTTRVLGDGCEVCNPAKALEYAKETIMELKEVARAMREWIDAVPMSTQLPAMPGFDRDWADEIIDA